LPRKGVKKKGPGVIWLDHCGGGGREWGRKARQKSGLLFIWGEWREKVPDGGVGQGARTNAEKRLAGSRDSRKKEEGRGKRGKEIEGEGEKERDSCKTLRNWPIEESKHKSAVDIEGGNRHLDCSRQQSPGGTKAT